MKKIIAIAGIGLTLLLEGCMIPGPKSDFRRDRNPAPPKQVISEAQRKKENHPSDKKPGDRETVVQDRPTHKNQPAGPGQSDQPPSSSAP